MNCAEFNRLLAADPGRLDAACKAHLQDCAQCTQLMQRAQHFEQRLAQVMAVEVPAGFEQRLLEAVRGEYQHAASEAPASPVHKPRARRGLPALAMAAVLVLALAASVGVWRYRDSHSMEAYAVTHLLGVEYGTLKLDKPINHKAVAEGFAGRDVDLPGPLPADITYVHDCIIGPSIRAVHLVMLKGNEPITVFFMPGRRSPRKDFKRGDWYGREVPIEHGTMVMLASSAAPFDAVQQDWQTAIDGSVAATAGSP